MGDSSDVEARLHALEAQVEELNDHIHKLESQVHELREDREIRELFARYGFMADTCNNDGYVELFTEDGVLNLAGGESPMVRTGKAGAREHIEDPNSHSNPRYYGKWMHVQGNNLVTHIDGDEAVANSYSIVLAGEDGGVNIIDAGNNQWQLEKVDGKWAIKERRRRHIGGPEYVTNLDATPR